jgi:hypothetical protein
MDAPDRAPRRARNTGERPSQPETQAMRTIHAAVLAIAFGAIALPADAYASEHYLELINRAPDSVTSLAIASAGSDAFREMPLHQPLRGGGDSTTVAVSGDGCAFDLRFVFLDGRTLIYRSVDICRYPKVRIQRSPSGDTHPLVPGSNPGGPSISSTIALNAESAYRTRRDPRCLRQGAWWLGDATG